MMEKEYYLKNKEEILKKAKEYANTDKGREACNRAKKKYAEKNKEKVKEQHKKYRTSEKGKATSYKNIYKYKTQSIRGKAYTLLASMRTSSKKRGHDWEDSWWSTDAIAEIILNGKCCKTGIKFEMSESTMKSKNPFAPSPDRIDNTKGYSPDNVQWVVVMYNMMKHTYTNDQVAVFINALMENGND